MHTMKQKRANRKKCDTYSFLLPLFGLTKKNRSFGIEIYSERTAEKKIDPTSIVPVTKGKCQW